MPQVKYEAGAVRGKVFVPQFNEDQMAQMEKVDYPIMDTSRI